MLNGVPASPEKESEMQLTNDHILAGTTSWPGLDSPTDTVFSPTPILANASPAFVPVDPSAGGGSTAQAVAPSSVSTTPATVGTATTATTGVSLWSYLVSVITAPSQHIVGVIVLLVIALWLYKHVFKKL